MVRRSQSTLAVLVCDKDADVIETSRLHAVHGNGTRTTMAAKPSYTVTPCSPSFRGIGIQSLRCWPASFGGCIKSFGGTGLISYLWKLCQNHSEAPDSRWIWRLGQIIWRHRSGQLPLELGSCVKIIQRRRTGRDGRLLWRLRQIIWRHRSDQLPLGAV